MVSKIKKKKYHKKNIYYESDKPIGILVVHPITSKITKYKFNSRLARTRVFVASYLLGDLLENS